MIEQNQPLMTSLRSLMKNINSTDLIKGKLGVAAGFIYHGSVNDDEESYMLGLDALKQLFVSLKGEQYINSIRELPCTGYVVESLSRNDLLEVDTDEILSDTDQLITHKSSLFTFSKGYYFEGLMFPYYLAGRLHEREVGISNFMILQMLIVNLIDITSHLDVIIDMMQDEEDPGQYIAVIFNIYSLALHLDSISVCNAFSDNLLNKIRNIDFGSWSTTTPGMYHSIMSSIVSGNLAEARSSFFLLVEPGNYFDIVEKFQLSHQELIALFFTAKSRHLSSINIWEDLGMEILSIFKDYVQYDPNIDAGLKRDLGLGGLGGYLFLKDATKSNFTEDILNVLTLLTTTNRNTK